MPTKLPYPKNEHVWTEYYARDGTVKFIITSKNTSRDLYYVYELRDGAFVKLGRNASPNVLEDTYILKDGVYDP